jgi:hypothetical protein
MSIKKVEVKFNIIISNLLRLFRIYNKKFIFLFIKMGNLKKYKYL